MQSKLMIVVSTAEKEKALTGLLYAANVIRNNWVDDVRVFFFGPFEKLLADDPEVQEWAGQLASHHPAMACKFIADNHGISDQLSSLGVDVQYVGQPISDAIKEGYVPMVF